MRLVVTCTREVPGLIEVSGTGNVAQVRTSRDRIFEHTAAADGMKNELRGHLPRSLFLPVDRRDLLEVLLAQSRISDKTKDIARLVGQRPMEAPERLRQPLASLAQRCSDVCEKAAGVIEELDELLECGFRGREATIVETMLADLEQNGTQTHAVASECSDRLFEQEDEMKPVSVVLWYQLIRWLDELSDQAVEVGECVRLLIAR